MVSGFHVWEPDPATMNVNVSKRLYSGTALEAWLIRLDGNWERHFRGDQLETGQKLYRQGSVRGVELGENDAIIHTRLGDEEWYAVIEWNGGSPHVRTSTGDQDLGRCLAVAGLYEIEELVGDEAPALPPESISGAPSASAEPDASAQVAEQASVEEAPPRPLCLVVNDDKQGLVFSAFWEDSSRGRLVALGKGADAAGHLTTAEREKLIRLTSMAHRSGFRYRATEGRYQMDQLDMAPAFVRRDLPQWEEHFVIEATDGVRRIGGGIHEAVLSARAVAEGEHGLRLDWAVSLDGAKLNQEEARRLILQGGNTLVLPGRGLAHLGKTQASLAESWREAASACTGQGFPRYLIFSLFGAEEIKLEMDEPLTAWRRGLLRPDEEALGELPALLRPYQKHGVRWMRHLGRYGCHGLLADEMGLGKTLQVLSLLAHEKEVGLPSLVVCPASVIPVWKMEAARFFPEMKLATLGRGKTFGEESGVDLWLASYTQLRRHKHLLSGMEFNWAILDEAQFIKNPEAKVTQACCSLRARRRVALTGTPLENRVQDLWTLFRFLMPGLLGSRRRFEETVAADLDGFMSRLQQQISPFVLRRTKSEVAAELPAKVEAELRCPMVGAQRAEYERLVREGVERLGEDMAEARRQHPLNFLSLLTRLRQACCDPGLLPWNDSSWESSGKLGILMEKLEELLANGRRVVIFSQFVTLLDRAQAAVQTRFPGTALEILTGRTRDREKPVKAFQELRGAGVMLVSLRAGGTGITLTNADYVFLLDPWWNPAVEQQAVDRVHRIGRRKPVFVYRLVAAGTIEERIQSMQKEKRDLFARALGRVSGGADFTQYFRSLSDLVALLPESAEEE